VEIWPAIDLLGGNCVRLQQGDYNRDTVFSDDPGAMASKWFSDGAGLLHCVDLDGAKSGSIINETAIRDIVQAANGRPVQLGGGVRTESTIERLLKLGLSRLVVGTAALKEPEWFATMCDKYPGHLELESTSPFPVICSGGITTLDDIRRRVQQGTHGAIIGRALYDGHMKLSQVLSIADQRA